MAFNTEFYLSIKGLGVISQITKQLKFDVLTKSEKLYKITSADGWKEIKYDAAESVKFMSFVTQNSGEEFKIRRTFYKDVTAEVIGTGDGSTVSFTPTLANLPVKESSLSISYTIGSQGYTATDDGAGNITGTNISSGTINYVTSAITLTFSTAPDNTADITIDYSYTDTVNLVVDGCTDVFVLSPATGYMDTIQKLEIATDTSIEDVELFIQIIGI